MSDDAFAAAREVRARTESRERARKQQLGEFRRSTLARLKKAKEKADPPIVASLVLHEEEYCTIIDETSSGEGAQPEDDIDDSSNEVLSIEHVEDEPMPRSDPAPEPAVAAELELELYRPRVEEKSTEYRFDDYVFLRVYVERDGGESNMRIARKKFLDAISRNPSSGDKVTLPRFQTLNQ